MNSPPHLIHQRTTNNVTKTTTYYLDLAGNVTQIVYPTGRTVNYSHDSADRPASATDASNGITYVADWKTPPINTTCTAGAVCYTPQGSVYGMSLGQSSSFTGFNTLETFNSRLQPSEIKGSSSAANAIDITYNFVDPVSGGNAGHVYGITNNLNSSRSQAFTYDQVNRILSAGTTATTGSYCWGYKYSYDAWGNLLSQAGWTPTYNACTESTMGTVTVDGNNHISGSGFSYDASGNTQGDGTYSYTWDGESQMKTAAGVTYAYDGDGRRSAKVGSKLYWYGSGGEILAETDAAGNTQNEYVFFGGKRVAVIPASGSALYYAADLLGSSRVIVQSNGTLCYDADFTPFGGERSYTSTCPQNYKFEGKERDTETQNDDFGARYYSWRFGRWLSSDWSAVPVAVPYANLTNPQTLNLYSMVADDPESFADLDGHSPEFRNGSNDGSVEGEAGCASGQGNGCEDAEQNAKQKVTTNASTATQANSAQKKKHHLPKPKPKPLVKAQPGPTHPHQPGALLYKREVDYWVVDANGNATRGKHKVTLEETLTGKPEHGNPSICSPTCEPQGPNRQANINQGEFEDDQQVSLGGAYSVVRHWSVDGNAAQVLDGQNRPFDYEILHLSAETDPPFQVDYGNNPNK